MDFVLIEALSREKGEKDEPEHIEGRHERGDERDNGDHLAPRLVNTTRPGADDDLVLAPESGERNHSSIGEGANKEREEGHRHVFTQVAHLLHVLLAMHAVDDATATEEE